MDSNSNRSRSSSTSSNVHHTYADTIDNSLMDTPFISPFENNYNSSYQDGNIQQTHYSSRTSTLLSESSEPLLHLQGVNPYHQHHQNGNNNSPKSFFNKTREANIIPESYGTCFSFRTLLSYLGPGFLVATSYIDSGNISANIQIGSYSGYQLLWAVLVATSIGFLCQLLALRLGVVTGVSLAQVCRQKYPSFVSYTLWILTEIAIICNDVQQIMGSSVAFHILLGLPLWIGSLVTAADSFIFLLFDFLGVRKLEAFFIILFSTMTITTILVDQQAKVPIIDIIEHTFLPSVKSYAIPQLITVISSIVVPHNIYFHSSAVLARKIDRKDSRSIHEGIKYFSFDAAIALVLTFIINAAVVGLFSHGFYDETCAIHGLANLQTPNPDHDKSSGIPDYCGQIGLYTASSALEFVFSKPIRNIFTVALLAAGQAATMSGTFAGQTIMDGFLSLKWAPWKRILFTRSVALVPALALAVAVQQYRGMEEAVESWLNVLQSMNLPFAILPVLHFAGSYAVLGPYRAQGILRLIMWLFGLSLVGINYYQVYIFFKDIDYDATASEYKIIYFLLGMLALGYGIFIIILVHTDILIICRWFKYKLCAGRPLSEYKEYEYSQAYGTSMQGVIVDANGFPLPSNGGTNHQGDELNGNGLLSSETDPLNDAYIYNVYMQQQQQLQQQQLQQQQLQLQQQQLQIQQQEQLQLQQQQQQYSRRNSFNSLPTNSTHEENFYLSLQDSFEQNKLNDFNEFSHPDSIKSDRERRHRDRNREREARRSSRDNYDNREDREGREGRSNRSRSHRDGNSRDSHSSRDSRSSRDSSRDGRESRESSRDRRDSRDSSRDRTRDDTGESRTSRKSTRDSSRSGSGRSSRENRETHDRHEGFDSNIETENITQLQQQGSQNNDSDLVDHITHMKNDKNKSNEGDNINHQQDQQNISNIPTSDEPPPSTENINLNTSKTINFTQQNQTKVSSRASTSTSNTQNGTDNVSGIGFQPSRKSTHQNKYT